MRMYNTLTKKVEEFKPIHEKKAGMYSCGLTVNNLMHIGHSRSYITWDIVERYLQYKGYDVTHVSNITDIAIDEKIIKEMHRLKVSFQQIIEKYTYEYYRDREALGIARADVHSLATQHIQEMVELVQKLLDKGYAYKAEDGIYFSIKKFPAYGKLSGISTEALKAGAGGRVQKDEYEKEAVSDFALWKSAKPGEIYWDSPFGRGKPGWHIECSAMSMKYLGETFDIHTGGEDNMFPHHENEIAQSEAATGKKFVNYWLHARHLLINGQKMSKSLGNFITSRDAVAKYGAANVRFFFASTHYRSTIDFNEKELHAAAERLARVADGINTARLMGEYGPEKAEDMALLEAAKKMERAFEDAMDDDLNTSLAIKAMDDLAKEVSRFVEEMGPISKKTASAISGAFGKTGAVVFGGLYENEIIKKQPLTRSLIDFIMGVREEARKRKDFASSDKIRKLLAENGVFLEDTKAGTVWKL